MAESNTPLEEVPLCALRPKTRNIISQLLNSTKVIPSPGGLPRDWRGLAHLAGISPPADLPDPTGVILSLWEKQTPSPNLAQLRSCFGQLDRWDVFDDSESLIGDDVKEYHKRKVICNVTRLENEDHILTVDDICRVRQDLEPQTYDAFLLYADEDIDFAKTVVDMLENHYGVKLCLKDRDLIGGVQFEHEAIMKLIAERCNRMIIIISPAFLESNVNKFFVNFAQVLGIEQRKRKIIPCVYQRFLLPPELRPYFVLDYNRAGPFCNFWDKLSQSIMVSPSTTNVRFAITEMEAPIKKDVYNRQLALPSTTQTPESSLMDNDKSKLQVKKESHTKNLKLKLDTNFKVLTSAFRKLTPSPEIKPVESKKKSKNKTWFPRK